MHFKKDIWRRRDHTVPIETPQSMLEEPSSGSKTTQYLHNQKISYKLIRLGKTKVK